MNPHLASLTMFALMGPIFGVLIFCGTMSIYPKDRSSLYFLIFIAFLVIGHPIFIASWKGASNIGSAVGFTCLTISHLAAWRGFQAFFGRPFNRQVWLLGGVFIFCEVAFVALGVDWFNSFALYVGLATLTWLLGLMEMWLSKPPRYRFPEYVLIAAVAVLVFDNVVRMASALMAREYVMVVGGVPFPSLMFLFILPMAGSIAVGAGLVLMQFNRSLDRIQFIAAHDELTGLLNRRAAVGYGEHEVARARRLRRPLIVAFIDIDHFKKINDTYSHDQGDAVLRQMAQVLGRLCRKVDRVSRYGGEEFCVMFSSDETQDPHALGRKLVDGARSHDFGLPTKVTVSVGIAVMAPDERQCDWHTLVDRADVLLYEAKEGGRDQYRIFSGVPIARYETHVLASAMILPEPATENSA
jgi:diguanylate cyclase (GGDEF)-like protein